jgi:hypothetical protein
VANARADEESSSNEVDSAASTSDRLLMANSSNSSSNKPIRLRSPCLQVITQLAVVIAADAAVDALVLVTSSWGRY